MSKCAFRAALDGCDTTNGDLKWGGTVKLQGWEYAIMAWISNPSLPGRCFLFQPSILVNTSACNCLQGSGFFVE